MNQVVDFINVNRDRYVEELKQYLGIPSISALPQHASDVRRAAEWTAEELRRVGLQNVRLIETPGNPVVYGDWLRSHKQELSADVVVISDSPMFDRGIPSICYGLRGLTYFQIDVRGTKTDLHSGSFGGAVANPAFVLAQMLAQMKDRSGRIKIPGFYDDVRELSEAERAEWKKLPFNETKYRKDLGAPRLYGETGYSTLERVWARPTFEVNGLLSGFTGEGAKTVLPATAMAKVSMRLVPDQDPQKIGDLFEAHIRKIAPKKVDVKITRMHGGKPWMTEFDNKYVRAAGRAIEQGV